MKVHKYYEFHVDEDKDPTLVLAYAQAVCEAFRRKGLGVWIDHQKRNGTDVTVHAIFEPDEELIEQLKEDDGPRPVKARRKKT